MIRSCEPAESCFPYHLALLIEVMQKAAPAAECSSGIFYK